MKLDSFTRQYLETMLWSTTDESNDQGGDPMDRNYSVDDIAPEAIAQAIADCERFQSENAGALEAANDWLAERGSDGDAHTTAAYLFWMNRNGHGVGFWEFDGAACESLNTACKAFGECNPYVGDDGLVYGLGETLEPVKRHISVRITYSTLTEESVSEGDHAGNGYMSPVLSGGYRQPDDDTPAEWSLREALALMANKCTHVETCWTPTDGTGRLSAHGTGNTGDCEDDEIEVCYDLHIDGVSDGTMMRLCKVLKANGVYFANMFRPPAKPIAAPFKPEVRHLGLVRKDDLLKGR